MANTVEVVFQIDKDQQGRTVLRQIDAGMNKIGETAKKTGREIDSSLVDFLKKAAIVELFRRGASAAVEFGKASVEAFNQSKAAALGLQSIAVFKGFNPDDALESVKNLQIVKDELLSLSDASLVVRNFLKTGFNLEQSIALTQRFADAAAFGKSASLSFADAIRSGSEGVATQSSQLLNNVGIVTNLATFLERAGLTLDDLTSKTKGAAATQALFSGLMNETADAAGNASKLSSTFAGQQARLEGTQRRLLEASGALITSNPDLANSFETVSTTIEILTGQLKDGDSALSQFVTNTVSKFSTVIDVTAKLANNLGIIVSTLDAANTAGNAFFNLLNPGRLIFGDPTKQTDTEKSTKAQFDKLRQLYVENQRKLTEEAARQRKDQPLGEKALEADRKAFQDLRKEGERALAELEAKNKAYAEAVRGSGDAVQDLANRLRVNPIANLYDEALRRQRDFMERFKEVPQAIKDAFVKANQDVLRLDLFKAQLGQAGVIDNLLLEKAKLESGLGGKANLDDFDQERLARLQREALDAQLRTAQGFLGQATNPAQRQLALEQILGATSNIGSLTSDQVQIRLKALNDQIAIQQQVFKENFERQKDQTNAQQANTVALEIVGNRMTQLEGTLQKLTTEAVVVKIINDARDSAKVTLGTMEPGE